MAMLPSDYGFLTRITILILITAGCGVVIFGLSQLSDIGILGLKGVFFYLLIFFILIITAITIWKKINPIVVGLIVGTILITLSGFLWPIITLIWIIVSAAIVGNVILKPRYNDICDNLTNSVLVGSVVYGTIIGLLAQLPVNYPAVYIALLIAPIAIWRRQFNQLINIARKSLFEIYYAEQRSILLDIAIAVIGLIYVVVALLPEVGFDALAMHLFIPVHIAAQHQWGFDASTYVWANMPLLGDWIYTIGYMLAGETACRLICVAFLFVLCLLIRSIILWAGGTTIGVKWSILIFLSTPLTFIEGSSLYIESIWASFLVGGTVAVLRICTLSSDQKLNIRIASILIGGAMAAKMLTLTMLPALVLALICCYKKFINSSLWKHLLEGIIIFLAIGMIPYLRAFLNTGNPVFPFFNNIFQSSYYFPYNFNNPLYNSGLSWNTIYNVLFDSTKYIESYPGASGFQWIIFSAPAFVYLFLYRKWKGIGIILISITAIAITFQSQSYLRYIFPSTVLTTAVLGIFLSDILKKSKFERWYIGATAIVVVGLNLTFWNTGLYNNGAIFLSLIGKFERRAFLRDWAPIRNAVELINQLNVLRTPVAVFASPMTAGLESDALYPNWYNYQFNNQVKQSDTIEKIAAVLVDNNVSFIILADDYSPPDKRRQIENVSEEVFREGSISIRRLKNIYIFKNEMLNNACFESSVGWSIGGDARVIPNVGAIVSATYSISQIVSVNPRQRYLNTIRIRCKENLTQARLQVNWLDSAYGFIKVDSLVADCHEISEEYSMEVVSPAEAAYAAVYCSGNTSIPIIFECNSFKR